VTFTWIRIKSHLTLIILLLISFLMIFTGLNDSVLQMDEGADTFVSTTILKSGVPMHSDGVNKTMLYADIFNGIFVYRTWIPYYLQSLSLYFLGLNTFAARLPFALAGFFSIWGLYHLTSRLTQQKSIAVLASIFLVTCVPALLYFRTSRYIALPILLTPITLSLYINIFKKKKWSPVALTIASIIFFHTMFVEFAGLILGMLTHLFIYRKDVAPENFKKVQISAAVTGLFCLPWLSFIPELSKRVSEVYTSATPYVDTSPLGYAKHFSSFLFQLNNYIFPLILLPLIFLGPFRSYSKQISLLLLCIFFIFLTGSIHSIPLFQYVAASIPIFLILLAWSTVNLFKTSAIQQGIFVTILIFSNIIHVAPLIPLKALVQNHSDWFQKNLYLQHAYESLNREVEIKSNYSNYLYEISHAYRGPLDEVVEFFKAHGKASDSCYIDSEFESLAFYTGMKMIRNQDLSLQDPPNWIVIRGKDRIFEKPTNLSFEAHNVKNVLQANSYVRIELNAPALWINNSYDIQIHQFRSPSASDKITIYQRTETIH
jgi:4-amino-4-deoxy-L-arabinose transferase-like glycosyltransferase